MRPLFQDHQEGAWNDAIVEADCLLYDTAMMYGYSLNKFMLLADILCRCSQGRPCDRTHASASLVTQQGMIPARCAAQSLARPA